MHLQRVILSRPGDLDVVTNFKIPKLGEINFVFHIYVVYSVSQLKVSHAQFLLSAAEGI